MSFSTKECSHCGAAVDESADKCSCGYVFPDNGITLPGPDAARSATYETTYLTQPQKRPRRSKPVKKSGTRRAQASTTPSKRSQARGRGRSDRLAECPSCGVPISTRAEACPKCGSRPWENCQICDAKVPAGFAPCPECGDPEPFAP